MSECASTVAVRSVLLSHLDARTDAAGLLALRGGSLLTGYVTEEGLLDPKVDGWLVTEDLADLDGRVLNVRGRLGEFIGSAGSRSTYVASIILRRPPAGSLAETPASLPSRTRDWDGSSILR